jgi:ketosteroid isomerase-like protein
MKKPRNDFYVVSMAERYLNKENLVMSLSGKFLPALIFIGIILGLYGYAQAQDDLKSIDRVRKDFNAASRASDVTSLAGLIDKNAVWMPPGQEEISGLEAIREYYSKRFRINKSDIMLNPGFVQVMGEWAFLHSSFSRVDSDSQGRVEGTFSGNYLWILKKQTDGSWKVFRDIWNEEGLYSPLFKALSQVEIFSGLTAIEREELKSAARLRPAIAEEWITRKGQEPEKMFIVMDAKAEVWVNNNLVTTLTGQSLIGETEFLNGRPMFAEVLIKEDTDIIELNNDALVKFMEKNPRAGYVIMKELAVIEAVRLRDTTLGTAR